MATRLARQREGRHEREDQTDLSHKRRAKKREEGTSTLEPVSAGCAPVRHNHQKEGEGG